MSSWNVITPRMKTVHAKLNATPILNYVVLTEQYEYELDKLQVEMERIEILYRRSCEEKLGNFLHFRGQKYRIKTNLFRERHYVKFFMRLNYFSSPEQVFEDAEVKASIAARQKEIFRHKLLVKTRKNLHQRIKKCVQEKTRVLRLVDEILHRVLTTNERLLLESQYHFFVKTRQHLDLASLHEEIRDEEPDFDTEEVDEPFEAYYNEYYDENDT